MQIEITKKDPSKQRQYAKSWLNFSVTTIKITNNRGINKIVKTVTTVTSRQRQQQRGNLYITMKAHKMIKVAHCTKHNLMVVNMN